MTTTTRQRTETSTPSIVLRLLTTNRYRGRHRRSHPSSR